MSAFSCSLIKSNPGLGGPEPVRASAVLSYTEPLRNWQEAGSDGHAGKAMALTGC